MANTENELYIKREYQRYPCNLPVKVITSDHELNGTAMNIGLGGLFVVADSVPSPLELDSTVNIHFKLPSMVAHIEVHACIRWNSQNAFGVQFIGLQAKDARSLRQYIEDMDRLTFIKTVIDKE